MIAKPEIRLAAIEGLGYSGDPAAIPVLSKIYESALRAARIPGESERFKAEEFAGGQARGWRSSAAALALYRVGDPNGVERVIAMHRRCRHCSTGTSFMSRVAAVSATPDDSPWSGCITFGIAPSASGHRLLEKLNRPRPPNPRQPGRCNLVKAAQTATDPADVEWLAAELERSFTTLPAPTWQSLTTAKDGIIARLARTALEPKPASQ